MAEKTISRFRTAMRRFRLSRPAALAWEHGLIRPGASFFDYGCGRGDDIRCLRENVAILCMTLFYRGHEP